MQNKWSLLALLANLVGSIFLWVAFQAAPAGFASVTDSTGHEYMCAGDLGLFVMGGDINKRGALFGIPCPTEGKRRPLAAVFMDHPRLMPWGWGLLGAGFLLEFSLRFFEVSSEPLSSKERKLLRNFLAAKKP